MGTRFYSIPGDTWSHAGDGSLLMRFIQKAQASTIAKKTVFTMASERRLGGGSPPRLISHNAVSNTIIVQKAYTPVRLAGCVART